MIGDTLYIAVGRKCGRTMDIARELEKVYTTDKKVVIVESKCAPKQPRHLPYSSLIDMDILSPESMERAEKMLNMFLKGENK